VGPFDACGTQGIDDCAPGSACIQETSALALCAPFCRTDADCEPGGRCTFTLSVGTLKVCSEPLTACHPVLPQSGCASGACYVITPDGDTGCHSAGPGGQGARCTTDYDCKAGYACFASSGGCRRVCRSGNNSDCTGSTSCRAITGWTSYGACK
jgi:hypothetical protein